MRCLERLSAFAEEAAEPLDVLDESGSIKGFAVGDHVECWADDLGEVVLCVLGVADEEAVKGGGVGRGLVGKGKGRLD